MRNLTDIQFWFARVKAAFADQMIVLKNLEENGELIDQSFPVRMQAAYAFINDVDWRIINTPSDLEVITKQIYKIIAFVGTSLPDVSDFYNPEVGNTNIVVGNGVSIPLATNSIYGKVRLSVPAAVASDPIAVGDNDPRLAAGSTAFDDTVTSVSVDSLGRIVLQRRDGTSITSTSGNILDLSGGGTQDAAISINGFIRTTGDLILDGIVNNTNTLGILSLGAGNVVEYLTLAQLAAELGTGTITANRAAISDGSGNIIASATTATEIGFVSGVTSSIQTQLNNKQPLDSDLTQIAALTGNGLLRKTLGAWGMDTANYLTANQNITLSGDISGSGSTAISTTIANGVVSFAKMQNINTNRLIGRSSVGVGSIQEILLGDGLSLSGGTLSNTITQYTDAMARASISETITGIDYNNTTGVFSLTAGYVIPTIVEQTNWTLAYNNMITAVSFDTSNGNLTLTQQDGGTLVQDLDGRYLVGNQTITLTGDITGSGTTAIATTIANDAVTFAKMQNVSTGVVLGRSSSGSGDIQEITIGSGLVLSAGTLSLGTITANRALVSGATGAIEASATTATQIGYLSTLTSNVQTQIDGKQPLDATLTALAAIGSSTVGIVVLNGVDSFVTRVLDGSPNRIVINNGNGSATNPTIDIASNYAGQSSITTLGTITSGVWNGSSIADSYIVSAANWNEAYDEHINSITWNAVNGNLTANQEDGGNITVNIDGRYLQLSGGTMTGYLTLVGSPINANHAATKAYVDSIGTGISPKGAAQAATTGTLPSYIGSALTLTGSVNGALPAQDGVTLTAGQFLLVKNETASQYNGIYELTQVGDGSNPFILTRASNSNTWDELVRGTIYITGGSTQSGYTYYCTVATGGTLGTTPVTYEFLNAGAVYLAGAGIDITGNTISIDSGSIVNSMISASAAIALNKLATTTASRALVSDSSGYITVATTTATEIGYLTGLSSNAQTQLNNKQPLDATLTALAAYNTNGILTQTAADTFVGRTLSGVTNRTTITNGDGVSGNPVIDISSTYAGQNTITILGTIATGTWQATAIADAYIASASNWNNAYNNQIVSASFNTGDGVLTLAQLDTGSVTVDLDGRYALGGAISGTSGSIAKFNGSGDGVIDSILSESAGVVTTAGSFRVQDSLFLQRSSGSGYLRSMFFWDGISSLGSPTKGDILAIGNAGGNDLVFFANSTEYLRVGAGTGITASEFVSLPYFTATTGGSTITKSSSGISLEITDSANGNALVVNKTGSGFAISVSAGVTSLQSLVLNSIASATTDTDLFLVSDGGTIKSRTGAQVRSDIEAQPLATNLTSLSALSYSATSFVKMTASGTFALDTNTYALDSAVVHISGTETITGAKTFSQTITGVAGLNVGDGVTTGNIDIAINGSAGIRFDLTNSVLGINRSSGLDIQLFYSGGNTAFRVSNSSGELFINRTPTTSASSFDLLTRNTSTGAVEKVASNYYATAGSISGTAGTLPIFNSSGSIADSSIVKATNTYIAGNTTLGNNLRLVSHSYGNTGIFELYGTDNALKLQLGTSTSTEAYIFGNTAVDLNVYAGGVSRMIYKASGSIITHGASATGEAFIIGGSARVNGTLQSTGNTYLNSSTGVVGIGTTTPIGNAATEGLLHINTSGSSNAEIHLTNSSTGATATDGGLLLQFNTKLILANLENDYIAFYTNNTEYLRLNPNGNLLVGTTADNGAKLQVAGAATFASSVTTGGALLVNNNAITQDGTRPIITLQQSGVNKLLLGISAGTSDIITGDVAGDVDFRTNAQAFNFSVDNGTSIAFKIASSGAITAGTWQGTAIADAYISSASTWNAKIGGSGTTNFVSKFTGSAAIGDSLIFDNGTNVAIGRTSGISAKFEVVATSGEVLRADANGGAFRIVADQTGVFLGGVVTLASIANATTDTDRFLVSDSGVVKYRTGTELLSDIGAAPSTGGTGYIQNQNASAQTANFWISGDAKVNQKVYIGTNGAYLEEVLVGSTYEIRVVDSAGNITVIS